MSDRVLTGCLFLLPLCHQEANEGEMLTLKEYVGASRWTVFVGARLPLLWISRVLCLSLLHSYFITFHYVLCKLPHQLEGQTVNNGALVFSISLLH